MPTIIREESDSSVATSSAMGVVIAVAVLLLVMAIGYFAWYGPSQATPAVIDRQTVIHDNPSPTVINPPAASTPIIIPGQQGPAGPAGAPGAPGAPGQPAPSSSTPADAAGNSTSSPSSADNAPSSSGGN